MTNSDIIQGNNMGSKPALHYLESEDLSTIIQVKLPNSQTDLKGVRGGKG
jgi:hypothetical protein